MRHLGGNANNKEMFDETFEKLKQQFLINNDSFASLVRRTSKEDWNQVSVRADISTVYFNAVTSYDDFMKYVRSQEVVKPESFIW